MVEEMKTILLLERTAITPLYIMMSRYMDNVKVIHVAYSKKEANELRENGIVADYVYLDLFRIEYDKCIVDTKLLSFIDKDILEQTNGRFNLNGAIQSDRGFSLLSYDESLKSAIAHYNIWKMIFNNHHVDLIAHEPCSLFFNFIGCILCKKQGGVYSYQVASLSDKYKYAYINDNNDDNDYFELKTKYRYYKENLNLIDRDRCRLFLQKFREEQKVFLGGLLNKKVSLVKLLYLSCKNWFYKQWKIDNSHRIYNNINYWIAVRNRPWSKAKNLIGYKWHHIKFINKIPDGEKFLFYPIHLEPEAALLYLGDGIYCNQIKLIENIAASLPVGYYLYVKDHPHEYAYRSAEDYMKLMKIPNIRLLNQWIPAKAIMDKAEGVITINGTSGFEALLMGKQVYCFGHNQYSFMPRVSYIKNVRDIKNVIYETINREYSDDNDLYAYVMAYLESCHPGYTDCYSGGPVIEGIDYEENAKVIASDLIKYIEMVKSYIRR